MKVDQPPLQLFHLCFSFLPSVKQNTTASPRKKVARLSGAGRAVGTSLSLELLVGGTGEATVLAVVVASLRSGRGSGLLTTVLLTVTGLGSGGRSGSLSVASGRGFGVAIGRATSGSGTVPDLGAGHGEGLSTAVDGEVGVLIGVLVGTGELDHLGVDSAVRATGNLDLSARDVVLGLVDVGSVDTDVLNSEEVLAVRGTLGDLDVERGGVVVAPGVLGEVTTGVADTLLHDLEPVAVSLVGLDVATSGGHIGQSRSGVAHLGTDSKLEGHDIAALDLKDLSVTTGSGGTLVADDVLTISERVVADIGGRVGGELDGVVLGGTSEVTDVLERLRLDTVESADVEEVVGRGDLREGSEGESGELHFEKSWFEG